MVLNFDGLAGCSGTAKALQIEGFQGADVSKLLRTAFATFCSAFPTDGANCKNQFCSSDLRGICDAM